MTDSGSIVIGWLTRLVVVVGLFGLAAFDGIAVVSADVTAADHAGTAAAAAAESYKSSKDVQVCYDAAVAAIAGDGDTVEATTFRVTPDGHVSLVVDHTATTLWLHRIGPLAHLTHVTAKGAGSPAT